MSSECPKVTIIVPAYNAEAFLGACLTSILNQEWNNFEAFIVDDGSTDSTHQIATEFSAGDSRLQVLSHPERSNRGVSRSRELGLAHSTGKYIALLDADDLFEPGKLVRQVETLERHPHITMCHTGVRVIDDGDPGAAEGFSRFFNETFAEPTEYSFRDLPDSLQNCRICLSSSLTRGADLKAIHMGFSQLLQHEDWMNWLQLSMRGRFLFLPERLTAYRVHPQSFCAGVRRNPLKGIYSRVEMCLQLMALLDDRSFLERVEAELRTQLGEAIAVYSRSGQPLASGSGLTPSAAEASLTEALWKGRTLAAEAELRNANACREAQGNHIAFLEDRLRSQETQLQAQTAQLDFLHSELQSLHAYVDSWKNSLVGRIVKKTRGLLRSVK